jgi:hypothetical protein
MYLRILFRLYLLAGLALTTHSIPAAAVEGPRPDARVEI